MAAEGRNCWRRVAADRLGVAIDAETYFRVLKAALKAARHSILIIGWDIDSRTRLERTPGATQPDELAALLDRLVRRRPQLNAHVLVWDSALIYAWHREFLRGVKLDWLTHRRFEFRFDDSHPLGASHHQKIVTIDDRLAFVGGLDLSSGRWDTRDHVAHDPRRHDDINDYYPPYHDLMAVISGQAAAALAELARARWRNATGRVLPAPPDAGLPSPFWPDEVSPLLRDVAVAIARTSPVWEGEDEVREVENLYLDMIAAARRLIYIENQYFASRRVGRALAHRLNEPDGPEIVIITPHRQEGILEQTAMGLARARLLQRLRARGTGRVAVYSPYSDGEAVQVHAKLMIVDDGMLRIGSANLNNRSMGLDTECDVLVEAPDKPDEEAIRRLRHDLLAEHLGVAPEAVAEAERRHGGFIAAIEALRGNQRTLEPFSDPASAAVADLMPGGDVFDPERPVEALVLAEEPMPGPRRRFLDKVVSAAALLLAVALAAAAWRLLAAPPAEAEARAFVLGITALADQPAAPVVAIGAFLFAGLMMVPLFPLVVAMAAAFGFWEGLAWSLAGGILGALLSFGLGRGLGRDRVRRLIGRRMTRVHRALGRHGVVAIAMLRLVPVAPFGIVNVTAGASRIALGPFLLGTVLGLVPAVVGLSLFGARLAAVLVDPHPASIAGLLAVTTALVVGSVSLARRLARARGGFQPPRRSRDAA